MTGLVGFDPTQNYTAAQLQTMGRNFGLMDVVEDSNGCRYMYVSFGATVAAGDFVHVNATGAATLLTTASSPRGNRVGVSTAAQTNGSFGFVQIYGQCAVANVLASCAANVRLNSTATAGSLDDDGTATTKQIQGVYLTTARGGSNGPAPAVLNYPYVDVTL